MDLTINEDKTKFMILSHKNNLQYSLRVENNIEFERVDNIKHLDVEINTQNNNQKEI